MGPGQYGGHPFMTEELLRSLFDRDRHLQIRVKDRRSDEVKVFMADLQAVSAGRRGGRRCGIGVAISRAGDIIRYPIPRRRDVRHPGS